MKISDELFTEWIESSEASSEEIKVLAAMSEHDRVTHVARIAFLAGIASQQETIEGLKKELHQQRFNNDHNLSIDQKVSDEIKSLREDLELAINKLIFSSELTNTEHSKLSIIRQRHGLT